MRKNKQQVFGRDALNCKFYFFDSNCSDTISRKNLSPSSGLNMESGKCDNGP